MILHERYEQMKVVMLIQGMAIPVGIAHGPLKIDTQKPSQKIWIKKMPKLNWDKSVIIRGATSLLMQENIKKAPAVRRTQLGVQKAQATSMTGVE